MRVTRGFDFRVVPTVLVSALFALLVSLGAWQLTRATDKRALLAAFDANATAEPWQDLTSVPMRFARVSVTGVYDVDRQVLMEGISHNGRPGYYVLTPLRTRAGQWLMVNRGWVAWQSSRAAVAAPSAPSGQQRLTGRATRFAQPGMRLGDGNSGGGWPRLAVYPSAQEISTWLGAPVATAQLLLDPDADGGFVRAWRPDTLPPSRHVGYAVQWFGLACALLILFILASRQTPKETDDR